MSLRIGVNGLGRIGRGFVRRVLREPDIEIAAVNDLGDPSILAHLLRHDSLAGRLDRPVRADGGRLVLGTTSVPCTRIARPVDIPWGASRVDLVLEATGAFTTRATAGGHLEAGVGRVIITSPSDDADLTVCFGINHADYDARRHRVLSNASCTTNAMAVLLKVANESYGIEQAAMTTVHCVTNNQVLTDAPHRDPRRARAAGMSMIPTSTSAAAAIIQVMPELRGRLHALAIRVPTAAVSLIDLTLMLRRPTTLEEARMLFRRASEEIPLRGILGYTDEPLVSIDFLGDTRSAVVDAPLLAVEGGTLLKVFAWYDNERGYVERLLDLVRHVAGGERSGRRD